VLAETLNHAQSIKSVMNFGQFAVQSTDRNDRDEATVTDMRLYTAGDVMVGYGGD